MDKDLISIIIPVYNREKLISQTLDSILTQSYKNWECIIVDDGSIDNTPKIIQKYVNRDLRFKYYDRPVGLKKGANACRNFGFIISKGNFIQWFDSDDIMHNDMLKIKIEKIKSSNSDFVVCEGVEFKNSKDNIIKNWDSIFSNDILFNHVIGKVNFHTNGPLFKKSFLLGKALFNENLNRKQEWEFFTRLLTYNPIIATVRKPLYYFRKHNESINGRNDINTLPSMILATIIVFKTVKNKLENHHKLLIRRHFFNRYLFFIGIAKKRRRADLIIKSIKGIFYLINLKFMIFGITKIIKNRYRLTKII